MNCRENDFSDRRQRDLTPSLKLSESEYWRRTQSNPLQNQCQSGDSDEAETPEVKTVMKMKFAVVLEIQSPTSGQPRLPIGCLRTAKTRIPRLNHRA